MFHEPVSIFGLVILILDILAIVSLLTGSGSTQHKLLWTVLILVLPVLGLILYFAIGRDSSDRPIAS